MKVKVAQSCPTLSDPIDYTVHEILQARILEWIAFPFSRGSSQPRMEPRSPEFQADSLPTEPQEKSKNTGVGVLSLLQLTFPAQESNWGLLHCRWILYQLSYQGSPSNPISPQFCKGWGRKGSGRRKSEGSRSWFMRFNKQLIHQIKVQGEATSVDVEGAQVIQKT